MAVFYSDGSQALGFLGSFRVEWSRDRHTYVFRSVRNRVLCHGRLCKASYPCIRLCLLGSVGLPVPRSSASPLPLMWVSGAGLIASLYSQNTVDCLRKWAQWLWASQGFWWGPRSAPPSSTNLDGVFVHLPCAHIEADTHTELYTFTGLLSTRAWITLHFSRDSCLDLTPVSIVY